VSWEPRLIVTLTIVARALGPFFDRPREARSAAHRPELDAAIRTAVEADVSPTREAMPWAQRGPPPRHCEQNEPKPVVLETPDRRQFRIQYLGGPTGQGPQILKEVAVRAPNVFAAFRAADHGAWPPGAAGFRLLDSGGEEVFWRRRPEKHLSEARSRPASRA
jgi:hypothetical protein